MTLQKTTPSWLRVQGIFTSGIAGGGIKNTDTSEGSTVWRLKKYLYSDKVIQTLRSHDKNSVLYLKNACNAVHYNIVYD